MNELPDLEKEYNQLIKKLIIAKEKLYPDAYPANLFKNTKRTKELAECIDLL